MKPKSTLITGFVLLLSVGFLPLKSQANPVEKEKITLLSAIEQISQEYDVYFTFDMTLVSEVKVEYERKEYASAEEAVSEILKGTNLKYKFYDQRFVILYKKGEEGLESLKKMSEHLDGLIGEEEEVVKNTISRRSGSILSPLPNRAFSKTIRAMSFSIEGKVTDEEGTPLIGVNIQIKGSNKGTSTDFEGKFILEDIDENSILVLSYVGYLTHEIPISGKSSIEIMMTADSQLLDEIVVVGYGEMRRGELTGSVSSIDSRSMEDFVVTRVEQLLNGNTPGVQVKSFSGEPGEAPRIRIRGIGSISAGVDPLYVVDGFPIDNIQMLNPNDIESIDILKDASASSIYGSRGANGVILITTKRGTKDKMEISINPYFGFQKVEKIPSMKNALDQANYTVDGFKNRNIDNGYDVSGHPSTWHYPAPSKAIDVLEGKLNYDVDPFTEVFKTAPMQGYNLGIKGGNENVLYAVSGSYMDQDGIILNSGFRRYSLRINSDLNLSNKLNIKVNLNPTFSEKRGQKNYGGGLGSIIGGAQGIHSWFPLIENNEYNYLAGDPSLANIPNPLARLENDLYKTRSAQILTNINVSYEIIDGLKYNLMAGTRIISGNSMEFKPSLHATFDNLAEGESQNDMNLNWIIENTLNYSKSLDVHKFQFLAGYTSQEETFESSFLLSRNYPNNLISYLSAVSNIIDAGSSNIQKWSMISYLARLNYNYADRYYLTASVRSDGSSRFGTNKKFGTFSSVGLSWRISSEKFLLDNKFIDDLKFRLSFGTTGNNNIGNYEHFSTLNLVNYPLGNKPTSGVVQAGNENPNLTWEKQKQFNSGLTIGVWKSRISLDVDFFLSQNQDLLLNVNTPLHSGFGSALQNLGSVENSGLEFSIATMNLDREFKWNTNFNISFYRNRVTKLGPGGDPIINNINITKIGEPMGMFYGLLQDGVFMSKRELELGPIYNPGGSDQSRVGDFRFVDVSGENGQPDGIIDSRDYTIIGNPYPDFYYGMSNYITYKGLGLNIHLQGVYGNDVYSLSRNDGNSGRGRVRGYNFSNNYWKSESIPGDGVNQRPNDAPTGGARVQGSQWLDDGSYLRITNITLNYSFPNNFFNRNVLKGLNIYLTATNPFIITDFIMFNPDASRSENPLEPGREHYDYPLAKSLVLGANLTF